MLLGSSHLVLVGRVELVPGFWVALFVPEAANMERFRASRIKYNNNKMRKACWRQRATKIKIITDLAKRSREVSRK